MKYKIISDFESINHNQWDSFIRSHPDGNIFQTLEMYKSYRCSTNYQPYVFVVIDENENLIGLLLSVLIKEKKGLFGYLTARSIIFGGPLTIRSNEVAERLLQVYNHTIKDKVIFSQVRNFVDTSGLKAVFSDQGYNYEDHLNILLDLSNEETALWESYSRSRKKGIKKAENYGYQFQASNDVSFLDDFYNLLTISYTRIKLPYPAKNHFLKICSNLSNEEYKIFMLSLKGKFVVSMIALQFKNTMYGYYMGLTNNSEVLKLKPSDLFFHQVFKWCIANGIKTFDWMGAGKPNEEYGVRDFKLQFGGNLVNFGRYTKIHKPLLYKFGKIALQIWKKNIK